MFYYIFHFSLINRDNIANKNINIDAVKNNGEKVIIEMLAIGGKQAKHTPDLRKLLNMLQHKLIYKKDEFDKFELIIIVETGFFMKKNLDVIEEFKENNPNILCRVYNYSIFALIVPNHISVPKHRIMDKEEANKLLHDMRIKAINLPRISRIDPPIVWLGASVGDIIEIFRISEITGNSRAYRIVV